MITTQVEINTVWLITGKTEKLVCWKAYKGGFSVCVTIVAVMSKSHNFTDIEKGMIIGYREHNSIISETTVFMKC